MTETTPTLAELLRLREAVRFICHPLNDRDPSYGLQEFAYAAHAALGPDGCLTKELERLHDAATGYRATAKSLLAERDALLAELERLETALANSESPYSANIWNYLCDERNALNIERDQLRAENEQLRDAIHAEMCSSETCRAPQLAGACTARLIRRGSVPVTDE